MSVKIVRREWTVYAENLAMTRRGVLFHIDNPTEDQLRCVDVLIDVINSRGVFDFEIFAPLFSQSR
jgi:hypothetical protein